MTLLEDNLLYGISRTWFEEYCGLDDYNDDLTGVSKPVSSSNGGNVVATGDMTVHEFQHDVRKDNAHYVLKYHLFVLVFSRIMLKSTRNLGSNYFM
jgi:hypothetical protein